MTKKPQQQDEKVLVAPQKKTTELQSFFTQEPRIIERLSKSGIVVLTGLDGAGKSSVANIITGPTVNSYDLPYCFLRSEKIRKTTTRVKRITDTPGEYLHVDHIEFETLVQTNSFLEYQEVRPGVFYGVLKNEVLNPKKKLVIKVLILDYIGAKKFAKIPGIPIFSISPSNPDEAIKRRITELKKSGQVLSSADIMAREKVNKLAWKNRNYPGFTFVTNDVNPEECALKILSTIKKYSFKQ